jgi:hypothetical protein
MLISSDRYMMNNGDGEIDCRLRSVIFERRGEYRFRFQCGDEPAFKSTMTLRDNELSKRDNELIGSDDGPCYDHGNHHIRPHGHHRVSAEL